MKRAREKVAGRADVIVGKRGLAGALGEIRERLKVHEVVKVKVLRTAPELESEDRREIAERVARELGAKLVTVRGRTFVLYKPKSPSSAHGSKSGV
ncbi:MAG: YhbY family RNA-binding protein [Acidilobaceae archaeon]|nr:YhbY family RNA-binding protein [Acidilobaceae archaeon]